MKVNWWAVSGTLVLVESKILGVSPERESLYQPWEDSDGVLKWRCLGDPSVIINYDQINDDYCDCPDGSDEVGTNACRFNSSNMFYCENKGHFPRYIENFKLNDGVCDYDICCDGSDEYLSGNCPDKCKEIHKQYEEHREKLGQSFKEAKAARKRILDDAKASKEKARTKLDENKLKKVELENMISNLQTKISKLNKVSVPAKEITIFDKISSYIDKISKRLSGIEEGQAAAEKKIAHLETILGNLVENYNPNFNDAAVKAAVNKYQNYVSNIEDVNPAGVAEVNEDIDELIEFSKSVKVGGTESVLSPKAIVPTVHALVHHYITSIFRYFDPEFAQIQDAISEAPETKSSRVEALEVKVKSVEKSLKEADRLIELLEANLELDFGEDDILRGIVGKTITTNIGGYEYKLGLLTSVYQDTNLLGKYSHHKDGKLYYNNGHRCWNGPLRSAVIDLRCGKANEIVSISEPEKCEYLFVVNSPVGCKEVTDEYIDSMFKVNYDLL